MSDFSVDSYSEQEKDPKNGQDPFSGALTKAQHRNPDIHVVGDNLPAEILSYQQGSGTLTPDVAGNTPQMMRARSTVFGNGAVQALTLAPVTAGNLSVVVTCPLQAAGSPIMMVNYDIPFDALPAAGAADNWAQSEVYVNGILNGNGKLQWSPGTKDNIGRVVLSKSRLPIAITPGATVTVDIRVYMAINVGPLVTYQTNVTPNLAMLSVELYY